MTEPICFEPRRGHLMPEVAKQWREAVAEIEDAIPDISKGESLTIKLVNDERRGLMIARLEKNVPLRRRSEIP